jgi:hypothetical protein
MPRVPGHSNPVTVLDTARNILFIDKEQFDYLEEDKQRSAVRVNARTPLL